MATRVVMPKLGMIMTHGTVAKWLKADGQPVEMGEPIVRVQTEKMAYEVTSPASGVLRTITPERQRVAVDTVVGWVLAPGEALPEAVEAAPAPAAAAASTSRSATSSPATAASAPGSVRSSPAARRLAQEHGIDLSQVQSSGPEGRIVEADVARFLEQRSKVAPVRATPLAQRIAQEHGIDLAQLSGSGPGGRIDREDVLRAIEAKAAAPAPSQTIPFEGIRAVIAERMTASLREMAQVTVTTEANVDELVRFRQQLVREWEADGLRPTYTDIIIKAVAKALKEHPRLNATLVGEEIRILAETHIGMAVALDEGLVVPVIRNADRLGLKEIAQATKDLAERARSGQLLPDDYTGGTFTVSNLGMYGVHTFTPIVNPPEAGILGTGAIVERPIIKDGQIAKGSVMALSLTFDHRLIDGAPAANFLARVRQLLENPILIFV